MVSVASFLVVFISAIIAVLRYLEYENEIQRGLYQSIVGNEYEFHVPETDETHHFEVVNLSVDAGHLPGNWRTAVVIEFDMDEFPWDPYDDEVAEDAVKDLKWSFDLLSKEAPEISRVALFDSYKAPALIVTFPSTDLYDITDFLRKTEETIGDVFSHYSDDERARLSMRTNAKYAIEYLAWSTQHMDFDDEPSSGTSSDGEHA